MLGVCGKEEETEDLGSADLKSACRIPGVDVGRRLRFLRQHNRQNARARAARGRQTPRATSRPMWECLVVGKVEGGSATLLVAKLNMVLGLPSNVTICVTTSTLGLLDPAVDRLLLEVTFVGLMLVENV